MAGNIWRESSRFWTVYGGTNNDVPFELDIADNSDIILTGETNSYGSGGKDAYLIQIDTNFNKIWDTSFGGTLDESGFSVKATPDGGCIITGQTYSWNIYLADIYLVKTNALGEATQISNYSTQSDLISIYPIPTTDAIIIESKNSSKIEKVSIYKLNGKILSTTFLDNKYAKIPVKHLANGIYIIEITIDKTLISKKFIKQ